MKVSSIPALALALLAAGYVLPASAQHRPKPRNPATAQATPMPNAPQGAAAAAAPQPGWVARCTSASRTAPLECAMEETAVLSKTGQLVVLVNIHVTSDTRAPVALIQLPLGLNLPAGAKLQVDDGKTVSLPIQTCENRGCYVNAPITPDVLAALKTGKQLKISFENTGRESISIPMPLANFAATYDKIK